MIPQNIKQEIISPKAPSWREVIKALTYLDYEFHLRKRSLPTELAASIGVHPTTVSNWIRKQAEPNYTIGLAVINWIKTQIDLGG